MNSLPRWLISITPMLPLPCQSSISAAACSRLRLEWPPGRQRSCKGVAWFDKNRALAGRAQTLLIAKPAWCGRRKLSGVGAAVGFRLLASGGVGSAGWRRFHDALQVAELARPRPARSASRPAWRGPVRGSRLTGAHQHALVGDQHDFSSSAHPAWRPPPCRCARFAGWRSCPLCHGRGACIR